ncbi:DUF167 domain-containing protein [Candidatus Peregrinibacteria bacterium]|nr:DUF167 domain-containing protein [Candidatus Peregrinibacteria bacterium]
MFDDFLSELSSRGSVTFTVRVRPGMAETKAVCRMADDSVKIDLAAKAERGKANAELVCFLAAEFGVSKDNVKILSGAAERMKLLRVIQ